MKEGSSWLALPLAGAVLLICQPASAQLSYSKGQSIYAAYEGLGAEPGGII